LSEAEQAAYLQHWRATEEWREAIQFFFESHEIDLAADAAESEENLAAFRHGPHRRSFLRRLFSRP
jgi:hypothetical protein